MTKKATKPTQISVISTLSVKDEQVLASSLEVANYFSKRHTHIISSVEKIIQDTDSDFTQPNFRLSEYKDASGKINKSYQLTKDGLTLLTMSFNGIKAQKIKIAYINAFNQLQAKLNQTTKKAQISQAKPSLDIRQHSDGIYIHTKSLAALYNCSSAKLDEQVEQIRELKETQRTLFKHHLPSIKKDGKGFMIGKELALLLGVGSDSQARYQKLTLLNELYKFKYHNKYQPLIIGRERLSTIINKIVKHCRDDIIAATDKSIDEAKNKHLGQCNIILKLLNQLLNTINNPSAKDRKSNASEMIVIIQSLLTTLNSRTSVDIDNFFNTLLSLDIRLEEINSEMKKSVPDNFSDTCRFEDDALDDALFSEQCNNEHNKPIKTLKDIPGIRWKKDVH